MRTTMLRRREKQPSPSSPRPRTARQARSRFRPRCGSRCATPKRPPVRSQGQLETAIASGRFVIAAEITPPVSCSPDELLAKATPLKGLADAVNVTDGAGARAHLGAMAAATILHQNGIEPVLQLTCRDRNRLALQSDLLGAAALGIRNLLVLRGDDPSAGD